MSIFTNSTFKGNFQIVHLFQLVCACTQHSAPSIICCTSYLSSLLTAISVSYFASSYSASHFNSKHHSYHAIFAYSSHSNFPLYFLFSPFSFFQTLFIPHIVICTGPVLVAFSKTERVGDVEILSFLEYISRIRYSVEEVAGRGLK